MNTLLRVPSCLNTAKCSSALTLALALLVTPPAPAATVIYVGTNGVSPTTNWSATANFVNASGGTPLTPANNAANFNYDTAVATPGVVTVHADGGYGTPGSGSPQAWGIIFGQTNGYHTVLIDPGIQLEMIAASGTPGGGGLIVAPANRNSGGNTGGNIVGTGPYTNYTTITGSGASFLVNGQFRVEGGANAVNNHYTILDMSGLDTFTATSTTAASSRFQVVNGTQRSQALVYLAKTNLINIYSDVTIGWMGGVYSNSLPIGLYLGQSNSITTGPNDNGNELVIALQGVTNAFMKFNPAFLGGPTKPTVYISGNGAASGNGGFPTVSGMMAGAIIGRADTAKVPSFGVADFTGGTVTWNLGQLHLGRSGAANGTNTTAMGTLTFDSGTITVNDIWCGWQQADGAGANGANPGIGVINIGTNATLQVNNTLRLAVVAGTPVAGSAGTVNVTGGTLAATVITNGGGTATINLTNSTLALTVAPGATYTNITAATITGGTTNKIAITLLVPATSYPFTNHLILGAIGGAGNNFGLQMPSGTPPYVAHLVAGASGLDLVVNSGPVAVRNLTWSGADPSGNWDIGTTVDWLNGATATTYNQLDYVLFNDTASGTTSVNLQAVLTPSTLTVSNITKTYTFAGGGALSGSIAGGLDKLGAGTLILAETGGDDFSGGVAINAGTVQVGDGATFGSGSLGSAAGIVANNGGLVFDRPAGDTIAVGNLISGAGGVTNAGDGTVELTSPNTFTGPLAINAGTLQMGNNAALGTTAGGTFIASGATLDLNGNNPANEPITVQGTGVGGAGAIINNAVGNSHLSAVTLAGDVLFGGSQRWDLTNAMVASTPHNVTISSSLAVYSTEWKDLNASTAVNNLTIASGVLGWVGNTTAGATGILEVGGGAALKFYNDGTLTANVTKPVQLDDGSTVANGGGANTISSSITFNGTDTFDIGGTSLTLSGALSGSGTLYKQAVSSSANTSPVYITGVSPSFSGLVWLYAGKIYLNGSLGSGSSSIRSESGTVLAGAGANNGAVDVSGGLTPGDAGIAGTMTFGSLTLEGSALVTNDLASTASGTSDLIVVNGDLAMNNTTMYVNPIGGSLENSHPYTLITYSGNFSGALPSAQTALPSIYSVVLSNATSLSPKRIQAIISGGTPNLLVWNNSSGNAEWDVGVSANWSNVTTHAPSDYFYTPDAVAFDDSITAAASPATNIDLAGGQIVSPSVISNNSTVNYSISGGGSISGGSSIVKMGSGMLVISNANDFTGPTAISGGTLLAAAATALGATNGAITITNGGTLDVGFHLGGKPIFVSGAGVGGNGAIVNNNGGPVYDDSTGGLANIVTLMGDTTFGGTNRWDLGSPSGATLSTGGKPYSVSITGPASAYKEWNSLTIDPALTNIYILASQLGVKGMTNLGDPNGTVTIYTNAQLTFWGGSNYTKNYYVKSGGTMTVRQTGPTFNLDLTLEGGAIFHTLDNFVKTMTAPVTLLGTAQFLSDNALCTFSNVISGIGGINWSGNTSQFAFAAANTYSGQTIIGNGLTLALLGSGSISSSSLIFFGGTDTNAYRIDATGRGDQTLTLASGQTLEGAGRVNGALTVSANATVAPGTNTTFGAIGASGAVMLNGTTALKIYNPTQNDAIQSSTSIAYGGTLNLEFIPGNLAAGNVWKIFNAPSYSGSFTLSPSSPGSGLIWDTSHLTTDGTLRVTTTTPPDITGIIVEGGSVILSGTNGTASGHYIVLSTTNVALPLSEWQPLATNQFDANGAFNWTNSIVPGVKSEFYRLQLQ